MPDFDVINTGGGIRPDATVDLDTIVGQCWTDGTGYSVPTEADQFLSNQPAVLGITEILKSTSTPVTVGEDFFGAHLNPDDSVLATYPAKFKRLRSHDFDPADTPSFTWREIQPTGSGPGDGGPINWTVVDRYLDICKKHGYIPYITLHGTPDWAVSSPDWTAGEVVAAGVVRKSGAFYYTSLGAGTCGSTAPTHQGYEANQVDVSDGGVTWRTNARGVNSGYGGKANLPPTNDSDMYLFAEAIALRVKNRYGFAACSFEIFNEANLLEHWAGTNQQMANCVKKAYEAIQPTGYQVHPPNLTLGADATLAEYTAAVDAQITRYNTVASGGVALWKYCDAFTIHTYTRTPANVRDLHLGINYLKSRISAGLTGNNNVGVSRTAMPIIDNEAGTNGCPCKAAVIMQRLVILAGLRIGASFYYAVNALDGTGTALGLGKYYKDWNAIREILLSGPLTVVNILPNGAVAFVVGGKQYRIDWTPTNPLVSLN